jgi:polar amino acid transport system substrate-binding protein
MGYPARNCAALLLLMTSLGLGAQERSVVFAVGEWPPFTGAGLPGKGVAAEIVSAACAAAGLRAVIEFFPWNRAEREVREGRAFATFPYLRIPGRESIYFFSAPIFASELAILAHASNPRTANLEYAGNPASLRGFTVGTTSGSAAVTVPLTAAGVRVEETTELDQSILKLERGRIDFVIDERTAIDDALKRLFPASSSRFRYSARNFTEKRDYLLLVSRKHPGSPELLELFDRGLRSIRANGTLAAIYAKHGIDR